MKRRIPSPRHALTLVAVALTLVTPAASVAGPGQNNGPTNSAAPTVSGNPVQGATLTATLGSWSGGVNSFDNSWQRCAAGTCTTIAGASGSSYTLVAADVGSSVRIMVTATNRRGSTSAVSAAVGPVAPPPAAANPPAALNLPAISGTPQEGQTLTASTGTWSNSPTSYAYQWSFCLTDGSCSPFSSGNGLPTYTLATADVGKTVKVAVSATNRYGSAWATSAATATVAPKPAPAPSPAVSITSPAANATVSGAVSFIATVANAVPQSVVMTVDGGAATTEYDPPYVYNGDGNKLDTTTLTNGSHILAAKAVLADGSSTSTNITVNVQNAAPPTTPVVSITSPAAGATISGSVPFTAAVTVAVPTSMVMTVDGGAAWTEGYEPWVYNGDAGTLDTTTLVNGSHVLAVKAAFADGSTGSKSITVNVQNAAAPPPPPPPPPSSSPGYGTGPIAFRYGDSYGPVQTTAGQGYDRYGVVVVGYGDDYKVAQLPTAKGLTYKTMLEVFSCSSSDICLSGASYSDALAAGALLKHSDGSLMVSASGYYLGDIGGAAYQNLWVQKVSARLAAQHLDGVFIDNVICDNFAENSGTSAKYPDDASWRAGALSFVKNVSAQMQAKGYYVLMNTYCYGNGSAASNTAWWNDVAPYPDGMITESFEQNPSNYTDLKYDCPSCSWMGDWKSRLDVLDSAQAAGTDAWELSSGGSLVAAKYACASFRLKWNGKGGGCGADTGGVDPYDASGWSYPIGTPTGTMTQSGAAFYRMYSNGKVIVNPSTASVTVLGITLAAKTAYIGP